MRYNRKQALLVVIAIISVLMVSTAFAEPDVIQQSREVESEPSRFLTSLQTPTPINPVALENCSRGIAKHLWDDGIDTRVELRKSGVEGRPREILMSKIMKKELSESKPARRVVYVSSRGTRRSSSSVGHKKKYAPIKGRWSGSHAEWDAIAKATLRKYGCSETEVREMMYIHHHEGGPNSISPSGSFYGGWQLCRSMALRIAWWDPAVSTARALRYVKGHRYSGFGSGVHAAYLHKRATGWY